MVSLRFLLDGADNRYLRFNRNPVVTITYIAC